MLPELNLDNESFENIMTEARNMIISLYPDWTDFNYHDPGITLIEMFSWLKEGQQFFLDQISDESREKYLKLLGIRPRHKAPASASVFVEAPEDLTVLKGTRLLAGDICFETDEKKQLIKDDVVACFCAAGDILGAAGGKTMGFGHNLGLPVFGSSPEAGNCFYMQFSHPLPQGEALSLYLELSWEYPVKRPNPQAMAAPMARISMEYMDRGGWAGGGRVYRPHRRRHPAGIFEIQASRAHGGRGGFRQAGVFSQACPPGAGIRRASCPQLHQHEPAVPAAAPPGGGGREGGACAHAGGPGGMPL